VLFRLAYLGMTNTIALLRLLPINDRDKNAEILLPRHQITVLERQLHGDKVRSTWADRVWLAALLHRLPRDVLRSVRLLVRPETVLRWHRDLIARRHLGSGREVSDAVRRDPRRHRHHGRAQRRPDAPNELDHGAVDSVLPP
jgi:hypothetical protein